MFSGLPCVDEEMKGSLFLEPYLTVDLPTSTSQLDTVNVREFSKDRPGAILTIFPGS